MAGHAMVMAVTLRFQAGIGGTRCAQGHAGPGRRGREPRSCSRLRPPQYSLCNEPLIELSPPPVLAV